MSFGYSKIDDAAPPVYGTPDCAFVPVNVPAANAPGYGFAHVNTPVPFPPHAQAQQGRSVGTVSVQMIGRESHPRFGCFEDLLPIQIRGAVSQEEWHAILGELDAASRPGTLAIQALYKKITYAAIHLAWSCIITLGMSICVWLPYHVYIMTKIKKATEQRFADIRAACLRLNERLEARGIQLVNVQALVAQSHESSLDDYRRQTLEINFSL